MKLKYFLLLVITFSIFHLTFSIAEVRYVSHEGNSTPPYTTWETAADSIQKCIDYCVDGDTVIVTNGTYYENLEIDTQISLIGLSADSTIIDGTGMNDLTIVFNTDGSIQNFNIIGKEKGTGYGIFSIPPTMSSIIKIDNCKITNTGRAIAVDGIEAENIYMSNLRSGIITAGDPNSNNYIKNCIILLDSENANGISLYGPNYANYFITNNIILFTGTNNQQAIGISIGKPRKVYIKNNLTSRLGAIYFHDLITDTAFIKNNIFTLGAGISSSGNKIYVNNVVLSNNYFGIDQIGGGFISSNYNLFWKNTFDFFRDPNYGDSDIVANPMFIKDTIPTAEMNFDYHLQAFSPGIDAGDPDILDVDGTRSDIGMFGGPLGERYTYKDLAPRPPVNLTAVADTNQVFLKWNRNTEADTAYYNVYRDTTAEFTIDSTKLIASPIDTFFTDYNLPNSNFVVYKITAVDNQGNESDPSEEVVIELTSMTTNNPMTINDYRLYQNYPNPFNPTTKIGYRLKEPGYVKLMVYDITGALVSVLVNKEQGAGYYEVDFNVKRQRSNVKGNLASGIYLYRIEIIGKGNIPVFSDMRKMMLIK